MRKNIIIVMLIALFFLLPDMVVAEGSADTKRYTVIGNAVSVPVIADIGKKIIDVFTVDERHNV